MNPAIQIASTLAAGVVLGAVVVHYLGPTLQPRSDIHIMGGTVVAGESHKRCKPQEDGDGLVCTVKVKPTYGGFFGKCKVVLKNIVVVHKGQTVEWELKGGDAADYVFDPGKGIEVLGNQDLDDDQVGIAPKPVFTDCKIGSGPKFYTCKSNPSVDLAKVLAYNVNLIHKTGKKCEHDPIIVNRDS